MTDNLLPTREQELQQQLAELYREYREKMEPILNELAGIEARKPMPPFVVM